MATQKAADKTDSIKDFRDISFIVGIYLYFSGWIYIYNYFNYFGLSIRQIDIEFYYFLVYSLNVFFYIFSDFNSVIYLVALLAFIICLYLSNLKDNLLLYVSCLSVFVFLFYTSFLAGISQGKRDRYFEDPTLKSIEFVLKDSLSASPIFTSLQRINKEKSLRLLTATKDEYFVVVANPEVNEETVDFTPLLLYEVKKENTVLMRIVK